ncbi:acetyl-CoA C-acetyltransferase [Crossiella cryophila]|uniref:Acetyl-CoA C-acetyltransferase n=1 Tax=Crossiella cryophila TaxID=43355 RepID=A0A7W7CJP9_9PSEU|nr:acetyl-CoA C-acetyltransferase [Crossiella cryophila]MBB4681031.1 acetyl-CoA C-acetyltransferase [Crossiella cryophila]
MPEAYLIDAVRTPVGRRGGGLSTIHPADLGAHVITALFERTGADPSEVDDVMFGCVDTIGAQAGDIARTAWLVAGYPEQVPGVTVDRQCGSSQQALHFAAQAVMSGTADLVVAGGVQNMSRIPIASAMTVGEQFGDPTPTAMSPGWAHRYGDEELSQFRAADHIALRWEISRAEMEEYALASHQRAITARTEGRFDCEIVPCNGVSDDEGPRADTTLDRMAGLKPLRENGRITTALSSQLADGASAILVASAEAVRRYKLQPRARVHHLSARGADPVAMLTAPIRATRHALRRAGMTVDEIDLFEVNEAFASVVLAWMREVKAPWEKVNVNGGAIALGHPIGATGTKLMGTLLNELERTGGRFGLQTMCEGGGQANVTIIERLG